MIEAVMALPVLVVVLIAVSYVHALLAAHQTTLAAARAEIWHAALDGCSDAGDAFTTIPGTDFTDEIEAIGPGNRRFCSVLEIPVVGDALLHFMPRSLVRKSNQTVKRPKPLVVRDEEDSVEGRIDLLCNEPTQSARDAAFDLLDTFLE